MSGVERSTAFLKSYGNDRGGYEAAAGRYGAAGKMQPQAAAGTAAGTGAAGTGTAEKAEPETAVMEKASAESLKGGTGYIGRLREDSIELSADGRQLVTDSMISSVFDILSEDYPGIAILAEGQNGPHDVRQIAAQLGKGTYVVVSREFLERMSRSQEDYEACKSILKESLRRLSSGEKGAASQGVYLSGSKAVSWYVPDQSKAEFLKKMAEAAKERAGGGFNAVSEAGMQQPEMDYRKSVHVSYSTMNHYSSMARAGSKSAVRKVMSDVYRSINNLRMAAAFGEEKDRVKAGQAMRSLQKLLARGGRKIRKLDQEEILGVRKKRAEKARKEKRVRQIKLELKKMRSARKGSDYRLIQEGISDTYRILGSRHGKYDYEPGDLAGSFDPYAGGAADIGAGLAGGADFSAADVVVSSEAAF